MLKNTSRPRWWVRRYFLRGLIIALPTVLGFVPTNTHAQQPFNTDRCSTIEKGNWQFQFLNSYDWLNESVAPLSKQNWANFSLGYGVTQRMEVGIVVPHLAVRGSAWNYGIGDTELNAKVQIIPVEPERRRPAVSIATKVEFPTGDSQKSLGSGYVDWDSTLIVESIFLGWTHRWNARGHIVWKYFDRNRRDFGEDDNRNLWLFHQSTADETLAMRFRVDRSSCDSGTLRK